MTVVAFTKPVVTLNGRPADNRQQFDRASQVSIAVTFYNYSGTVDNPASAKIYVTYRAVNDGCRVDASYDLTKSGDIWSYTWDSSVAQRGTVWCHLESLTSVYTADFSFRLKSNLANMDKFGDDDWSYR